MALRMMAIAAVVIVTAMATGLSPLPAPTQEAHQAPAQAELSPYRPHANSPPPWPEGVLPAPEGPADVATLICSLPWPCHEALQVAACESRLDPMALGSHGELGVFQVMPTIWGPVPPDAAGQARQAFRIWQEHGWEPWSCQPRP